MTERVSRLIAYLEGHQYHVHGGVYSCTNKTGDRTAEVYCADGVTVLYSPDYDYLEILGLTDEEFIEAATRLDHSAELFEPVESEPVEEEPLFTPCYLQFVGSEEKYPIARICFDADEDGRPVDIVIYAEDAILKQIAEAGGLLGFNNEHPNEALYGRLLPFRVGMW